LRADHQSRPWIVPSLFDLASKDQLPPQPTTGTYATSSLVDAAGRLGTFIGTQEYYYARPDKPNGYAQFKEGYEGVVEGLISRYAPDPVGGGWERFVREVKEAVERFFEKFEGVYEDKARRKGRGSTGGMIGKE
jgi:hypothetical protein